jgi:cytoskeletal protein CcmA (bactofilin family)
MMLKKSITQPMETAPATMPAPATANATTTTVLAAGTEMNGKIKSNGDIRIDGLLIGDIQTNAKVMIGPTGEVRGDIQSQYADVLGKVTGNLKIADLLCLKANSSIHGNVYTGQLQVDPSASFNGECHMGKSEAIAQVVAIQQESQHASGNS